jgi:hypothetical protein
VPDRRQVEPDCALVLRDFIYPGMVQRVPSWADSDSLRFVIHFDS